MSRAQLLAALVVAAVAGPSARAMAPRAEVLLLAGTTGRSTASTTAVTDPAAWYRITVTGVVSYNGRTSLADCGHRDESDEAGWHASEAPFLDGTPSPCSRAPAHASHTYCWRQRGTGHRLTFAVRPFATDDDEGAFVIEVDRDQRDSGPTCALLDVVA